MINNINIIKGQHLTEKTSLLNEKNKSVVLHVDKKTNKLEIKKAIENIFKVQIKSVRIINVKGKKVKFKSIIGRKKNWKKAIISLKEGYTINFSEYKI